MVIRKMRDRDDCRDDGDDDGFDHNDDGPNHDHARHEDDQGDGEEGEGYMLCTLMGSLRVAAFALEERQASLDQLKGDRFIHGMSNLKKKPSRYGQEQHSDIVRMSCFRAGRFLASTRSSGGGVQG